MIGVVGVQFHSSACGEKIPFCFIYLEIWGISQRCSLPPSGAEQRQHCKEEQFCWLSWNAYIQRLTNMVDDVTPPLASLSWWIEMLSSDASTEQAVCKPKYLFYSLFLTVSAAHGFSAEKSRLTLPKTTYFPVLLSSPGILRKNKCILIYTTVI